MLDRMDIALIIVPLVAGLVGAAVFPLIIKLSYKKKFFKKNNSRTVHGKYVSTLGGIGIFMGLLMGMASGALVTQDLNLILVCVALAFPLMIVFILGVWDDLQSLKANEKLILQSVAALALVYLHPLVITNFGDFLGLYEIPYWIGFILSFLVVLTMINAVNLLDGIDGFAGLYVMLLALFISVVSYLLNIYYLQVIGLAVVGVLAPFLYFNMYHRRKLFMGDSGSLLLGLLASYFVLSIYHELQLQPSILKHPVNWSFALVALPMVDLFRVIVIRLSQNRPIFSADKNHIHHAYLNMGLTHNQTTFVVMQLTVSLWLLVYWFEFLDGFWHGIVTFILMIGLYLGPIFVQRLKETFIFE